MPVYKISFLDQEQKVRAEIAIEYSNDAEVIATALKVDVLPTDFGIDIRERERLVYAHRCQ